MLELLEVPVPTAGDGEVLVRIEACGICGSDMHAYAGDPTRRLPFILGHEATGVILSGPRSSERVCINPLITCGLCEFCLDGRPQLCLDRQVMSGGGKRAGAFAEIVSVPERNIYPLPSSLSFEQAALAEPIAVGYHAVVHGMKFLARPIAASRCCVIGGGAVGLGTALSLAYHGAKQIYLSESDAKRRVTASRAAPVIAYAPASPDGPEPASIDLIIDCVSSPQTRSAACNLARRGAVIVQVGVLHDPGGINLRQVTMEELVFTGTYCYSSMEFGEVIKAMGDGLMGSLDWFEARPMSAGSAAFQDLDHGTANATKIVLLPAQ